MLAREPDDQGGVPLRAFVCDTKEPSVCAAGERDAGPAAGIEPALSRLRGEHPYPQRLTGRVVPPEVGTSGGTGYCGLPQVPL